MIVYTQSSSSKSSKKPAKKTVTVYSKYTPPPFKTKAAPVSAPRRADHSNLPSVTSSVASTAKKEPLMYSGDKLLGISVQHKSCLAPIFSQEEATDAAHMRR